MSAKNPAWIGVTIYAGFIEEFAYRAVLTLLFAEAIGYWPAAIVSALLFGMAHLSSGLRALPASIFFALAMQLLVFVSGGLLLAVVVHIAYDLIAAWLGRRMAHASKSDGSSVL
ncbi:MAG: CPBP family intramembrane glutamic endopeptidase [Pseudomonadota bacterium]